MADISLIRHQEIFDPNKNNVPVHIIGVGATGSRLWLSLVELGMTNIHVYDYDDVEAHNLANQVYLKDDVGTSKVRALKKYYQRKTGETPPDSMHFHNVKVEKDSGAGPFDGVVFLLTDTMASRKEIFENCIANSDTFVMIETRMASSYGDIKTVNPFDKKQVTEWFNSLSTDEDTEVSACGSSISVGPTAAIIANIAVWQMIHALTNPEAVDPSINLHLKPMMMTT